MLEHHVGHKVQGFDSRQLTANKGSPNYSGSTDLQRWKCCSQEREHLAVLFSEQNYRNLGHAQPLPLRDAPAVAMVVLGSWSLWDATFGFGDQNLQKW